MTQGAHVESIGAVRDFRAALASFALVARESLLSFDLELRRSLEWLRETQPEYWKMDMRHCDEAILAAKIDLERCRASRLPGGETPACSEEKKNLERAKRRRQYAEDKILAVRKWGRVVEREADEYAGRASQLQTQFDADLPRAVAMLDRALDALAQYTRLNSAGAALSSSLPPAVPHKPDPESRVP